MTSPPSGLCGSGLVDAVAELVRVGVIDSSGRFVDRDTVMASHPHLAERMTKIDEEKVFVLAETGDARCRSGGPQPTRRA